MRWSDIFLLKSTMQYVYKCKTVIYYFVTSLHCTSIKVPKLMTWVTF